MRISGVGCLPGGRVPLWGKDLGEVGRMALVVKVVFWRTGCLRTVGSSWKTYSGWGKTSCVCKEGCQVGSYVRGCIMG